MLAPYQISHPEIHGLEEVSPIGNLHIKHKPDLPRIPERNQVFYLESIPGFNSIRIPRVPPVIPPIQAAFFAGKSLGFSTGFSTEFPG